MNRNNRFTRLALILTILALSAATAAAQQRLNDKDVEKTMNNLKEDAKKFRKSFDLAISKSTIRKTSAEKDAKALSKQFESQTVALLSEFKRSRKPESALQTALSTADQLQKVSGQAAITSQVSSTWDPVRTLLDRLAVEFNLQKPASSGS